MIFLSVSSSDLIAILRSWDVKELMMARGRAGVAMMLSRNDWLSSLHSLKEKVQLGEKK
jgi:hypothetical protein